MSTTDAQLADLLGKNSDLFAAYEVWANAQIMLLAGSVGDPDSFDAEGGKTGPLGYYPVVNVSDQTIYVPSLDRLRVIATSGAEAEVIASFDAKVTAAQLAKTEAQAAASDAAAVGVQTAADATATQADRLQTSADRTQTTSDRTATAADRVATGVDKAATAADRVQTGLDRTAAHNDATATAADRVQTGLDRTATGLDKAATAADRAQTGLDRAATGSDKTDTAADRVQTGVDRVATAAAVVQTASDKAATAADRVQTGVDKVATAADRVQTGVDRTNTAAGAVSAAQSVAQAAAAATAAGPSKVYVLKADATADLANIAANAIALVVADESNSNLPTYYQKAGGALVLKASPFALMVNAITPKAYGAKGDGATSDAAALINMGAAALAQKLPIYLTSDVNIPAGTTVTLPDVPVIFSGGMITGAGTVIFAGGVSCGPVQLFAPTLTVKLYHQRQPFVYAEWWGAKPLSNLRTTVFDANNVDSTTAITKALNCGYGFDGSNPAIRYTIVWYPQGWYGVSDEILVDKHYLQILGKNPSYGGTGFRWVGAAAAANATKSILHIRGAQFSTIADMGFIGPLSTDSAQMLYAAIRSEFTSTTDTERKITYRNICIDDNLGSWVQTGSGWAFQNGILTGGPGSQNGNDDFFHVDNVSISALVGIRDNQSQAVSWNVDNYQFITGKIMYQTDNGGALYGRNWYAARQTYECVIKAWQPTTGAGFYVDIQNFANEHMQAGAFFVSNMPVLGTVNGYCIQFTSQAPQGTISQAATTLTCTQYLFAGHTEFFSEYMIGQQVIFADGTQSGKITAIAADKKTATCTNNQTVAAQTGRVNDLQGYRAPYLAFTTASTCSYSVTFDSLIIGFDDTFGTPNPTPAGDAVGSGGPGLGVGTRIGCYMISTQGSSHDFNFSNNASGVSSIWFFGGNASQNQPRVINVACRSLKSQGSGSFTSRPITMNVIMTGKKGQDANGNIQFLQYISAPEHHLTANVFHIGVENGSGSMKTVAASYLATTPAAVTMTFAALLGTGRIYKGVNVFLSSSVTVGQNGFYGLGVGIPGSPWRFGLIANAFSVGQVSNGLGFGGPANFSANTNLVLTGIYTPQGTLSQAGNVVTATSAQAFGTLTVAANLVGQTIYWVDANLNITASAVISAVTDATHVVVTDNKAVPAGTANITYPMNTAKKIIVTPVYQEMDFSNFELNRYAATLPTLAFT